MERNPPTTGSVWTAEKACSMTTTALLQFMLHNCRTFVQFWFELVWETLLYTFRWKYEAIQSFQWWPCSPAQPTAQALTAVGWLHFIFCWYLWSYFFNSYIPGHFITQNWTSFLHIPFVLILDQYQERYSNFKAQYHKVREPLAHEGTIKNVFCIFPLTLSIFHQIGHMRVSSDAEFTGLHDGGIGFEIWSSIDEDI